ncbi:MAG: ZIP family metal transporter, partial [bacterium]
MTLAIVSVFVVWIVSFAGAAFPLLTSLSRHPYLVMSIRLGSFAGSGVMLATAFVHMLFAANESLTSNCLPESWLDAYGPWAFLFACLTIIILQTIDYVLYLFIKPVSEQAGAEDAESNLARGQGNLVMDDTAEDPLDQMEKMGTMGTMGAADATADDVNCKSHVKCKDEDCNSRILLGSQNEDKPRGALLSNLIVSVVSISVHSVVIGLSLGLSSSDEMVALFVAIIFHQLLEGIALGSATAESGLGNKVVLLFAAIYSVTTPIGIAVGIAVHESLDTSSPAMLYTVGILDAIAAGALIYLSLADHMNALRVHAKWMRRSTPATQVACFAAFY